MASTTTARRGHRVALLQASVMAKQATAAGLRESDEQAFMAENRVAMDRRMAAMPVAATGEVDRDFATMMIPLHRGRSTWPARNFAIAPTRRIAQGVVVEQQETEAMRPSLRDQPQPPAVTGEAHR